MFHSLLASLSFLHTWLRAENHRTEPFFREKQPYATHGPHMVVFISYLFCPL